LNFDLKPERRQGKTAETRFPHRHLCL